jgi:hypothetical protein
VYHIELRQFPHNMCQFNLTEQELFDNVVLAWAQGQWIDMGDRKWNAYQAKLKVLEGPHLPLGELTMGRGWSNAERRGKDVTEQVIARAMRAPQTPVAPPATRAVQDAPAAPSAPAIQEAPAAPGVAATQDAGVLPAGDPTGQLQSLLGTEPAALLAAWRLTAERRPALTPSESLALAETTLSSLDAGEH